MATVKLTCPRCRPSSTWKLEKAGYNARPDMSESDYTVVSNISRYGMAPVEAGAYIADVIQDLLQKGGK